MSTDVKVPQVGESITEAVVVEWLVPVGGAVALDQDLVVLETDKITVNAPSPVAGVLTEHVVKVGDTVEIGAVFARITAGAVAATPTPAPTPTASAPATAAAVTHTTQSDEALLPAVRRLLEENGLASSAVTGTGPGGRILKEDVLRTLAGGKAPAAAPAAKATPAAPAAPVVQGEREEIVPMTRLRQTIARRLVEAQQSAAILTTFNEVDMSAVMSMRARYRDAFEKTHKIKLGFMSFFAKAVVEALKAYPSVNAELSGNNIIYKHHYDIGVAVGGGKGLVVPVVRDADQLSFAGFEKALSGLAEKARNNTLSMSDLQGGTFTISNGGVYGSLLSTPILNPPQSGILGLHKTQDRPVAIDGKVEIRPMMYVALSYDHRLIDGREAVGFLVKIKECLEDPARILIEV